MKVKVSYTTNLETIPYECWRLLDYKIHDAFQFKEPLLKLNNDLLQFDNQEPTSIEVQEALENIHKMRSVLSDYDQCLSDINKILSDWHEFRLHNDQQHVTLDSSQQNDE